VVSQRNTVMPCSGQAAGRATRNITDLCLSVCECVLIASTKQHQTWVAM